MKPYILAMVLLQSILLLVICIQPAESAKLRAKLKRSFWQNKYYLKINNDDPERYIEFTEARRDSNGKYRFYAILDDGRQSSFTSPMFEQVGSKGIIWVNPGGRINLPLSIPGRTINKAEYLVLQGVSYSNGGTPSFIDPIEQRDLVIRYRISTGEVNVDVGESTVGSPLFDKPLEVSVMEENEARKQFMFISELKGDRFDEELSNELTEAEH